MHVRWLFMTHCVRVVSVHLNLAGAGWRCVYGLPVLDVLWNVCTFKFWLSFICSFLTLRSRSKPCTVMVAGIAEDIGRQLLTYHRRLSKPELFARIDAVTPATIKRVAERFIYDQDLAIAAIGDVQNLPDYTWFRRRTYWLRY